MDTTEEGEGGMNRESSIETYTLPCVKQIANGKLLNSAGSSAWCSVMTQSGGTGWAVGGRLKREGHV